MKQIAEDVEVMKTRRFFLLLLLHRVGDSVGASLLLIEFTIRQLLHVAAP